jgi:hypothetical protein
VEAVRSAADLLANAWSKLTAKVVIKILTCCYVWKIYLIFTPGQSQSRISYANYCSIWCILCLIMAANGATIAEQILASRAVLWIRFRIGSSYNFIQWGPWIRIRNPDPDPVGQKGPQKIEKSQWDKGFSCSLDVLNESRSTILQSWGSLIFVADFVVYYFPIWVLKLLLHPPYFVVFIFCLILGSCIECSMATSTLLHLIFFKGTHHQLISMLANLKIFFKILWLIKLHCTIQASFSYCREGSTLEGNSNQDWYSLCM